MPGKGVYSSHYSSRLRKWLPKSDTAERPITLTHVVWRTYCRLRWPWLEAWIEQYPQVATWDSAVSGVSCLDVSLRRLVRMESSRTDKIHMIL